MKIKTTAIALCLVALFISCPVNSGTGTEPAPTMTPVENFPDTDTDGYPDYVEVLAGSNPNIASDTPASRGYLVFVVDKDMPVMPLNPDCALVPAFESLGVFILVDATNSMSGTIANLKSNLIFIIADLSALNPNIMFGVGTYRDFPTAPYGNAGDWPFKLHHRMMTVKTAAGIASLQSAVNALTAGGGNDGPESSWEALHQIATGMGTSQGGAAVPAFNPATAYPTVRPAGETFGTLPGAGFGSGSFPIIVWVTDAVGHNSDTPGITPPGDYAFSSARSTQAVNELKAVGAHVIGLNISSVEARNDQLFAVKATRTKSTPNSGPGHPFSGITGCATGQCATGLSGAGEAPNTEGLCDLSFLIDSSGAGFDQAVSLGIKALTQAWYYDLSAGVADDPTDSADAVTLFVDRLEALPGSGLTPVDTNGDGTPDTYVQALITKTINLRVYAKANASIARTAAAQCFRAEIRAEADGQTGIGRRSVLFIVPPLN